MRSVSTDSAHVPHEGEVSNTNVTPERTESEVVPHVDKSILAPASHLTPVTSLLAPMRVNKPQVTFDVMNTKLADGPNVSTATIVVTAPPWLNGSTSTMQDWRSWVQFPWVTSTFNVDIARIFVFYLAMVRNCCGLLWRQSGGCCCLPYTMSAKAVRWVPLDRDRCTLYKINKSMFMFMLC